MGCALRGGRSQVPKDLIAYRPYNAIHRQDFPFFFEQHFLLPQFRADNVGLAGHRQAG
jgi:hypothetical protein